MIKRIALSLSISIIAFGQASPMRFQMAQPIHGDTFLAIEKAAKIFRSHHLDISKYNISVADFKNSIFVFFQNRNRPDGVMGNPGPLPEFEVELRSTDLKILKSNFVR